MKSGSGKGTHRSKSAPPSTEAAIQEAKDALSEAREERRRADQQAGLVARLREGWERVHERNNLARLFTDALEAGRQR